MERGNRVISNDEATGEVGHRKTGAQLVLDCLLRYCKKGNVRILRKSPVKAVKVKNGRIERIVTGIEELSADRFILATGGKSYPKTGSTGDGYRFAAQAGHTVTELRPSLIPIEAKESWCRELMGLSLKNVMLSLRKKGKKGSGYSELGEMLFTHFGVSGPLVLSASAHMAGEISDYSLGIDLKPGLTPEQLDSRLLRDFGENLNRDFGNSLGALLPRKLIPVIVKLSGIGYETKVNSITKEQRKELGLLLKNLVITPKAFRPIEEAVVTSGGVKVSEVDPKTMQSKLVRGLFFAGEILDLDAYTGGFNLQIAFSTGYLAGMNV